MKKILLVCLLLMLLAGSAAAEPIRITAEQISAEYQENQIAADGKYKGNLVEVTGAVFDIRRDAMGTIMIDLYGDGLARCVSGAFHEAWRDKVAQLKKNQFITIRGVVDEFFFGNVYMQYCEIVQQ